MIMAWFKLRRRSLGPLLDASGWAVNTGAPINLTLGKTLTAVGEMPPGAQRSLDDPYGLPARLGHPAARKFLMTALAVLLLAAAGIGGYWVWRGELPFGISLKHQAAGAHKAGAKNGTGAEQPDKAGQAGQSGQAGQAGENAAKTQSAPAGSTPGAEKDKNQATGQPPAATAEKNSAAGAQTPPADKQAEGPLSGLEKLLPGTNVPATTPQHPEKQGK